MDSLGAVIAERLAAWGIGELPLERMLFGTDEPDLLATIIDAWCCAHLDAGIGRYLFFESSSGSVHGVALTDGRRVVVKGHRPAVTPGYLAAVAHVQGALADAGYPAPRPLLGPIPVGVGNVTVETMLPRRRMLDPHARSVGTALARGLVRFIEIASPHTARLVAERQPMSVPSGDIYPTPHSPRFDFAATAEGAEWIDELAREARALLRRADATPTVVHGDWRVENVSVDGERIVAVYDWDSVTIASEATAIATAATTFTVDWQQPAGRRFPNPSEMRGFISDFEQARGNALQPAERDEIAAAMVAGLAYGARCEHAVGAHAPPFEDSQRGLLQRIGPALLHKGLDALD